MAGGGTGGHLFPGVAVARALARAEPSARITFVGTRAGIETRVVPLEGFELDLIRSTGLKGKSWRLVVRGLAMLPRSALDAWRVISRRQPSLVVGLGGYSSGPLVLVAAVRGIPTMLMEQNVVPGLANRLLARVVQAAAVTYADSLSYFGNIGFVSGNPVRQEFLDDVESATEAKADASFRVLVFGGSQGAHAINMAFIAAARELASATGPFELVHQTGERDLVAVRSAYEEAGVKARVEPFLHDMGREMRWAQLVVSRAGATTLAELAALGRPALLVPLPWATNDHQRRNAAVLAEAGAALVLEQRDLTGRELLARILEVVGQPDRLSRMSDAMRRFARPDAARVIAERVLSLVRESTRRRRAASADDRVG